MQAVTVFDVAAFCSSVDCIIN